MPVPTMPAKAAAAAAPPPRYALRRALKSVAPLAAVAVERPCPDVAEPARASEGSSAVRAIAATVAMTVLRPIDENTAFRANIVNILRGGLARQAYIPTRQPAFGSTIALGGLDDRWRKTFRFAHRSFRFDAPQ